MKDKLAGYSIFVFSLLILGAWVTFTGWGIYDWNHGTAAFIPQQVTIALLAAPVILAMIVVFIIAAWIGWTMARTPPPAPIDLEDFEGTEETSEEKKEES
ncbi:MAG: hypothetical protein K9W42_03365 [Candidatus Heimdallarchaeota archaeon]|nr:hypothetical protein [Candidatus Heimdallarchaeota archaeon]